MPSCHKKDYQYDNKITSMTILMMFSVNCSYETLPDFTSSAMAQMAERNRINAGKTPSFVLK